MSSDTAVKPDVKPSTGFWGWNKRSVAAVGIPSLLAVTTGTVVTTAVLKNKQAPQNVDWKTIVLGDDQIYRVGTGILKRKIIISDVPWLLIAILAKDHPLQSVEKYITILKEVEREKPTTDRLKTLSADYKLQYKLNEDEEFVMNSILLPLKEGPSTYGRAWTYNDQVILEDIVNEEA